MTGTVSNCITQFYKTILLRDPTTEELNSNLAQITAGLSSLDTLKESLIASDEANIFVDFVVRLYEAAFGRKPDPAGLEVNVNAIRSGIQTGAGGITITQLADAFSVSAEFTSRFGGSELNRTFLLALYDNVLERVPSETEINGFLGKFTTGQTIIIFSNSPEFVTKTNDVANTFLRESADGTQDFQGSLFGATVVPPQTLNLTTANDTLVGGAGDDNFTGDFGTLNAGDDLDGGAGTADQVSQRESQLTASSSSDLVTGANNTKNIEIMATTASGRETTEPGGNGINGITIKANDFTSIDQFKLRASLISPQDNADNQDGDVAVQLNGWQSADSLIFEAASGTTTTVRGGTNSNGSSATGGDAINVDFATDSSSNTLNFNFLNATTITGAVAPNANDQDFTGDGVDAVKADIINITTASADADVTFAAGARTTGSARLGDAFKVDTTAVFNITGAGDVNLGNIDLNGNSGSVTVNADQSTGKLTVITDSTDDVIKGGSQADSIDGSFGADTLTGNGSSDTFNFANQTSTAQKLTTITDFSVGSGGDIIKFTTNAGKFETLSSSNATAIAADTSLTDAAEQAFSQLSAQEVTAFLFQGDAYVLYNNNGGSFEDDKDTLIKLQGITDISNFDASQIT